MGKQADRIQPRRPARTEPRILLLAAIALLCAAAAGCGRDAPAPSPPEADPAPGGTAVVAIADDPDVLNPLIYRSAYAGQIAVLLLDSQVEMGEDLLYHPLLADSVAVADDRLTVEVTLKPWNWSDGTPLTARDIVSTWRLFVDPAVASPRAGGRIANIAGIEVLGPRRLRYAFVEPRADVVATLGHFILPSAATDTLDPGAVRSWPLNESPPSCGRFVLSRWLRDRELVLARNEAYPGRPPLLDRVVFRVLPDQTARLLALETGEVDFVEDIPPRAAKRLEDSGEIVVHRVPGRLVCDITWNQEREVFRDRRVRRALSLAIDRSLFVDGLLDGGARPAAGPIPPASWAFHDGLAADPHDPQRARELLDAAGWIDTDGDGVRDRDGAMLRFTLLTRRGAPVREAGAVIVRENLAEVGVEVETRVLELASAIDMVRAGRFDAYLGLFSARLSPDPWARFGSDAGDRFNYGHYASAAADSLMRAAAACVDRGRARGLWRDFQELIAADSPCAFLYYPDSICASSARLRGVRPHPLTPYNRIEEWWIHPQQRKYPAAGAE